MEKIMATQSIAATQKTEYRLPEADRLAIIGTAPGAKLSALISRQRETFMAENNGDPFGLHHGQEDSLND